MTNATLASHLDPTPDRPSVPLGPPPACLALEVEVEAVHLANPLVAVARLLASEAEIHARVTGDEDRFTVSVALPDRDPATLERADAWIRWSVHNAGVRGRLRRR